MGLGIKGRKPARFKLDLLFLRRFWRCLRIIFPHWLSTTFLLFVTLLGLSLAEQMIVYNTGLIPSKFYEVLGERDKEGFKSLLLYVFLVISGTALAKSTVQYASSVLHVKWRGMLTRYLHRGYFANNAYYNLNVLQDSTDNPDQRITQDVDRFCNQLSQIISTLVISPFTISYYTYQCYQSSGFLGPVCIYGYFVVGAIINKIIMAPVIDTVVEKEKREGDFRFKHMQVRVNAEPMAFFRSGKLEEKKTDRRLQKLLDTQMRYANFEFILYVSINLFDYIGSMLSYIIIAIALFAGKYDSLSATELSSEISKNSFVAMYLIGCFSKLNDWASNVSDMAGYTHRIGELAENLETLNRVNDRSDNQEDSLSGGSMAALPSDGETAFKLSSVTYGAPNSLVHLVQGLDLEVKRGENLLITGTTGSGKSSLLRILNGLWQPTSGHVTRNIPTGVQNVCFLPQKPFLTDGTLRQQIVYPFDDMEYEDYTTPGAYCDVVELTPRKYVVDVTSVDARDDSKVLDLLETVGLTGLLDRVGGIEEPVDWNWEDMLSPGEMQRLSFARLFYHKPIFAVLDEATSALDVATEAAMYNLCRRLEITVISVGHREALLQFHKCNLILDGDGGWQMKTLRGE